MHDPSRTMDGRPFSKCEEAWRPRRRSLKLESWNSRPSSFRRAAKWLPIGKPEAPSNNGTDVAGNPASEAGAVNAALRAKWACRMSGVLAAEGSRLLARAHELGLRSHQGR